MRKQILASLIVLSCVVAFAPVGSTAPKPSPPPPPAQGTITISYSGAGTMPNGTPGPDQQMDSTLDMQYREVLHVTAGGLDKATGVITLQGTSVISFSMLDKYDGRAPTGVSGCYTGYWTVVDIAHRRWTEHTDLTRTNVRRKVTMSSNSNGTLHIGYYPGAYADDPRGLPSSGSRYEDTGREFLRNNGCDPLPQQCLPSMEQTHCGVDVTQVAGTSNFPDYNAAFPDFYTSTVPEIPVQLDRRGNLLGRGTFALTWGNDGVHRPPVPIVLTVNVDVSLQGGLIADAGGPYVVERGTPVTLDARQSRTTDGVAIQSYSWAWAPEADCRGKAPINSPTAPSSASVRSIVPLCTLQVTLTVKDAKKRLSTAKTYVVVRPRKGDFAATPVIYERTEPSIPGWLGGNNVPHYEDMVAGTNGPACENSNPIYIFYPWMCPTPRSIGSNLGSWIGDGYTLAAINDPGGPFDGFHWVATTNLTIDRIGYLNSYLTEFGPMPDGATDNWYTANSTGGYPVEAFLAAVTAHEGLGPTWNPAGGHTGALKLAMEHTTEGGESLDPRRRIENQFDASFNTLQSAVNTMLVQEELDLCNRARDPLPVIWSGTILLWKPALIPSLGSWMPAFRSVGAIPGDCVQSQP